MAFVLTDNGTNVQYLTAAALTTDEYDMNIKNEVCAMQLARDLRGVTKEQMKDVVIACK